MGEGGWNILAGSCKKRALFAPTLRGNKGAYRMNIERIGHEIALKATVLHAGDMEWMPHPVFSGVALKHLVTGKSTDANLSCHLVRLAPACSLPSHCHETQWEQHLVLQGSGTCISGAIARVYTPGTIRMLAKNEPHEVHASEEGLELLAIFSPALC